MGSYSVVQCVRLLMGHSLYCSAACGEREAIVMAPTPTHDSAVFPGFHGCLAFLHSHFPPQSPPSHPLNLSLHSQLQPSPWDCSIIPKFQFPAALPCRRPASCLECMAAVRRLSVCFSLQLGFHRSAASLSDLNVSPLTQTIAPVWGSDPASVPLPTKGRSSPTNTPVFPSSSFILLFFLLLLFCVFFSTGQVLLSALSWCSTHISVCEGVFLMYLWREMYSMFTYSSTILFHPAQFNFLMLIYCHYISQTFLNILASR